MPTNAPDLERIARSLACSAYTAYYLGLKMGGSPYFQRVSKPRIGDWVVETSSRYQALKTNTCLTTVGELLRIEYCPMYSEEVWAEQFAEGEEPEPIPTEDIYVIRLLDGREYRWSNAEFVTVPSTSWHSGSFHTIEADADGKTGFVKEAAGVPAEA